MSVLTNGLWFTATVTGRPDDGVIVMTPDWLAVVEEFSAMLGASVPGPLPEEGPLNAIQLAAEPSAFLAVAVQVVPANPEIEIFW